MSLITTAVGYLLTLPSLLTILFIVLLEKAIANHGLFDPMIKTICRGIPLCFGIRVRVRGAHHIHRSSTYIFMSNHVNVFDPILLYGYIPAYVRALELEDHFSWPVWGAIIKHAGMIPISQRHVRSAMESLDRVAELLAKHTSIVILPEGHRTRDGRLGKFMRGPFRLAISAGTDIVPVTLRGLYERKSVHSLRVKPGTMDIVFSKPIPTTIPEARSEKELREAIRSSIQEQLDV